MSKQKLILDDDGYNYFVLAISCHLKDFRVAWFINRQCKLNLSRCEMELKLKSGESLSVPFFLHTDSDARLRYVLLPNHTEDFTLVRDLKSFDYFMIVEGYLPLFNQNDFIAKLRQTEAIQHIELVSSKHIEPYQYLIFEN
ncbi:MAG: hypothetical protein Kow0075_16040 [Salibacteraceae bacterium]